MISIIIALLTRYITLRSSKSRMVQNDDCSSSGPPSVPSSSMVMSEDAMEVDITVSEDPKIKGFDELPMEVKEVIFFYLSPRDLKKCCLVSQRWKCVANSNRVWSRVCDFEALSKKEVLDDSCSMIKNPIKNYSYIDRKVDSEARWKSHYNRYLFVQKNWLHGYYVLYRLPLKPILVNEQCIVEQVGSELIIYTIHGLVKRFCSVDLASPESRIDTIIYKNGYLLYTQNRNVVCLKKDKNSFNEVLQVALGTGICNQPRNNCVKPQFTIRISDKFIVVQDPQIPCSLSFYETNDGSVRRQIDLHKVLGNDSLSCTCLEVLGDTVFLGYRMGSNYFITQYDYNRDLWETHLFIPSKAVELHVTNNILCAKVCSDNREQQLTQISHLHVWLRESQFKLGEYCANKHVPVVLTPDDMLIYSFKDEITLRKLGGTYEKIFSVSPSVMNICKAWDKFLIVHDERGVGVWDCTTGQKIVSPLLSETCIAVCASDTNILLRCEDDRFLAVSYW